MHLSPDNPGSKRWMGKVCSAVLVSSVAIASGLVAAQTPSKPASKAQAKSTTAHRHHAARKAQGKSAPPAIAAAPAPPPAPPKPNWPANQPAAPASVTWDAQGLEIKAANSSLQQILSQVESDTGTKVEGLTHDERVFGVYGPAPAREVLSELLHGTGYNVLILGEESARTPLKVILSARSAGGPQVQASPQPQENDETDYPQEPPQAMPPGPPMPGNQPQFQSPQQRWQQMQEERQRQIQQQIEEQQQGPPPQ